MRYLALAADYDGTIAHHGLVAPETLAALERLAASGRRLILVTGRELDELLGVFPDIGVFDLVVAENGGLLYWPQTRRTELLCDPPHPDFVAMLRARGVDPLAVGRSIVATVHPHETVVLGAIRDLGLELHVIFNKGAVMVLPTGVNKATGLTAALARLGLSPHNTVAVGDAENDQSMLQLAEFGAATANAVPMLKEAADRVLAHGHGIGVAELIADMIADDLAAQAPVRRAVLLGHGPDGAPYTLPAAAANLLVAGASGSGKSTLATGLLERLAAQGYQCCIVDPEGDYERFPDAIVLGDADAAPSAAEIASALEQPEANVVVSMIGLPLGDRPAFFVRVLAQLAELRARTGRPHCVLIDETHHLLPPDAPAVDTFMAGERNGLVYVTVHPGSVAPEVLRTVHVAAATGDAPAQTMRELAGAIGAALPEPVPEAGGPGQALLWDLRRDAPPVRLAIEPSVAERRRHRRKYAAGELPPDRSFYFRGPDCRLNLRAQNLLLFLQIAAGVDDDTWTFHLHRGDYSEWLLNAVKDHDLAQAVRRIEKDRDADAATTRARIREAVERRYTEPAEPVA
jgi:hydroxymethylpyrimidine pyrophosphatase-like HAD family hydrolase